MADVQVIPTFLLRGITHGEMLTLYRQRHFSSCYKIYRENSTTLVDERLDSNRIETGAVQTFKTRSNHKMTVMMAGAFEVEHYNGKDMNPGGLCKWCRDPIKSKAVGVPIKYEYDPVTDKTKIVVVGRCDTFECAYALYISKKNDPLFSQSEPYLLNWFRECHPGETLVPAKDWDLHVNSDGELTSEKFHSNHHHYVNLHCICVMPAQTQYLEL